MFKNNIDRPDKLKSTKKQWYLKRRVLNLPYNSLLFITPFP